MLKVLNLSQSLLSFILGLVTPTTPIRIIWTSNAVLTLLFSNDRGDITREDVAIQDVKYEDPRIYSPPIISSRALAASAGLRYSTPLTAFQVTSCLSSLHFLLSSWMIRNLPLEVVA